MNLTMHPGLIGSHLFAAIETEVDKAKQLGLEGGIYHPTGEGNSSRTTRLASG
jgi:hypothetical protein